MTKMTTQEAIKAMKFYKEKLYNGIFNQFIAAFDVAISALEKQIPKKPTIKKSVKVNAFTLRCPNCEAVLQADSPCCRYCGQALEWSDTK